MAKLWGGRFEKGTHHAVEAFTASIGVDARLWKADIQGSVAHARGLGRIGVLSADECSKIVEGLKAVEGEIEAGRAQFHPDAEDVHSEIERLLTEELGPLAGKLHTARSRNDQVATATRLYLRGEIAALSESIGALQAWIVAAAEKNVDTILPGMTHVQHAQPVTLAHHLLAYFWMLERDRARLSDCLERVNVMPLGSAALAGSSFPLDRQGVAQELGFARVSENSMDAVSDRDFVVEFLGAASLILSHLSRWSEELILWSCPEFGFIELSDAVTTGSSIMPQKKNPDVAELIRGRTGRVTGALMGALTMLKGLPLSYNRDLQEDKTFLFEGLDTAKACVDLMRLMLDDAEFKTERMERALAGDFSNATDLADALVRKGLPFRQAHEVSGKIVRHCLETGRAIESMSLAELRKFSELFDSDVMAVLSHRAVMEARVSEGGTAPAAVRAQLAKARAALLG